MFEHHAPPLTHTLPLPLLRDHTLSVGTNYSALELNQRRERIRRH